MSNKKCPNCQENTLAQLHSIDAQGNKTKFVAACPVCQPRVIIQANRQLFFWLNELESRIGILEEA